MRHPTKRTTYSSWFYMAALMRFLTHRDFNFHVDKQHHKVFVEEFDD